MESLSALRTKIFADGASLETMRALSQHSWVKGFTTNPTLMRKEKITDYERFAHDVIVEIPDKPVCFGVFSDDFDEMYSQALTIAGWGNNIYVKIPCTNTRGQSSAELVSALAKEGVQQNVTAVLTLEQVEVMTEALAIGPSAYLSVFAGRIADTGVDPMPIMKSAVYMMSAYRQLELIWASPRELLNIMQADEIGCHIITVTQDILKKMHLVGKGLAEYALETVRMFHSDAVAAGYCIPTTTIMR